MENEILLHLSKHSTARREGEGGGVEDSKFFQVTYIENTIVYGPLHNLLRWRF